MYVQNLVLEMESTSEGSLETDYMIMIDCKALIEMFANCSSTVYDYQMKQSDTLVPCSLMLLVLTLTKHKYTDCLCMYIIVLQ